MSNLKVILRNTLRTYLYPQCLIGETDLNIPPNYKAAESFIPLSHFYQKAVPYRFTITTYLKAKRIGTIDAGLGVNIRTDNNDIPSTSALSGVRGNTIPASSIATSYSTIQTTLLLKPNIRNDLPLGSKTTYWLELTPLNSTGTITMAKTTEDKYLSGELKVYNGNSWSSSTGDLFYKLSIKNWIWEDYPREDLSIYNYPRIAVDIVGKPRIIQKWISWELAEYYLTLAVTIYSRYPDEIETISSLIERALFKERTKINTINLLIPGNETSITPIREKLFSKTKFFTLRYRMTTD